MNGGGALGDSRARRRSPQRSERRCRAPPVGRWWGDGCPRHPKGPPLVRRKAEGGFAAAALAIVTADQWDAIITYYSDVPRPT